MGPLGPLSLLQSGTCTYCLSTAIVLQGALQWTTWLGVWQRTPACERTSHGPFGRDPEGMCTGTLKRCVQYRPEAGLKQASAKQTHFVGRAKGRSNGKLKRVGRSADACFVSACQGRVQQQRRMPAFFCLWLLVASHVTHFHPVPHWRWLLG